MSYKFETGKAIGLEAGNILPNKGVRGGDDVLASLTLPAVPVKFRSGVYWTTFEAVRRD